MDKEHRAQVEWSPERVHAGLPVACELVAPAWFHGDAPDAEGWSVRCRFERPPAEQGSPSEARVAFVYPEAPHARLAPGVRLALYEGPGPRYAMLTILE